MDHEEEKIFKQFDVTFFLTSPLYTKFHINEGKCAEQSFATNFSGTQSLTETLPKLFDCIDQGLYMICRVCLLCQGGMIFLSFRPSDPFIRFFNSVFERTLNPVREYSQIKY